MAEQGFLNRAQQTPPQGGVSASGVSPEQSFPPEKQQLFERAFQVGKNVIYEKQVFGGIIQQVDSEDPAFGLAEAIVMVLRLIEKDEQIGEMPIDVALAAGLSLMGDLVDALTETGRGPYDQAVISKAVEIGIQMFLQMNGGRVSPEELQAQMAQLQSAVGGM